MLVWGLTGNIACGKSAVEDVLRAQGVPVIDADVIARQVVAPGQPALAEIKEAFGSEVLLPDGQLNRAALGDIVFGDGEARQRLEAITHPQIIGRIFESLADLQADGHALAVVSAALMVESGSYRNYAGLAVVTCPEALQLQRLRLRDGLSENDALARIRSQRAQEDKAALADVVFDNSEDLLSLQSAVERWLTELRTP
ncbi:MAG: dephospho-CoA kinase [Deltaproteobacteria bacterium]|nr:dephospho-CoA kinase [Deltaproteobacteria bacterium]